MKKIMNDPENFVDEGLKGILRAYPDQLTSHPGDLRAIMRVPQDPDKVSIVTGGGYGHVPLFLGYVGDGLCDGAAVGNVFTTPSNNTILKVMELLPGQKGILCIFGNYTGDRINFEMAASQLRESGVRCEQVVVTDDVMSAPNRFKADRRCIAGIVLVYKIAGACARRGDSLDEILAMLKRVNGSMGSIGVALTSCHIPTTKDPIFQIAEDEMELGMGIHGEPGVRRTKIATSKEIAKFMTEAVAGDLGLVRGERTVLLLNGMSAMPKDELFILYGNIRDCLDERGILVERSGICHRA